MPSSIPKLPVVPVKHWAPRDKYKARNMHLWVLGCWFCFVPTFRTHGKLVGQINAGVGLSAASWPLGMVTKHGHPQWPVGWEEGIQLLNHAFSSLHSLFLLN